MTGSSSDRPDWLPAPDVSSKPPLRQRARLFAAGLPSLVLIAIGIALVMLAGASLAAPKTFASDKSGTGTAVLLVLAAGLMFAVAVAIRSRKLLLLRPAVHSIRGEPMTVRQFFGAALKVIAIWQMISAIVESPQMIAIISTMGQVSNISQLGSQRILLLHALGPILRVAIAIALFSKADSLAGRIYPDSDGQG